MSSYTTEEKTAAEDITMLSAATILLSLQQPTPPAVGVNTHPQRPCSASLGTVLAFSGAIALHGGLRIPARKVQIPPREPTLTARMHALRRSTAYAAKYHGPENRQLVQALERCGWTRPPTPPAFVPGVDDQMDVEDEVTVYDEAADDDRADDPDATESESETAPRPFVHGVPPCTITQALGTSRAHQLKAAQSATSICRAGCMEIDNLLSHADASPISPHSKPTFVRIAPARPTNTSCSFSAGPYNSCHLRFRPALAGTQDKGKALMPVASPDKVSWSDTNSFGEFPFAPPSARSIADITPADSEKTSRQSSKGDKEKAKEEELGQEVVTRVGRRTKKPRRM